MREDRRAALEAIAYGDDPELRPADRLKALELLEDEKPDPGCAQCRHREAQDAFHTPERATAIAAMLAEIGGLVPVLLDQIECSPDAPGLLGKVAREEAETLSKIEEEIERRAEVRARALVAASPPLAEPGGVAPEGREEDEDAASVYDAPPGLGPSDIARGFPSGRPRQRARIGS